jgi:Protein of unknown function (DUF1214)
MLRFFSPRKGAAGAFALTKKLGGATFYIEDGHDSHGQPLSGENAYRLHVPPDVPAKQYWPVTVYDLDTACLIRDMPSPGLDSYNQKMHRNGGESVDIYFGWRRKRGRMAIHSAGTSLDMVRRPGTVVRPATRLSYNSEPWGFSIAVSSRQRARPLFSRPNNLELVPAHDPSITATSAMGCRYNGINASLEKYG